MELDYCIYFDGNIYGWEDSLESARYVLRSLIEAELESGNIDDIDLAECQITSVPVWVDEDGNTDYMFEDEQVEYCADVDDDYESYYKWNVDN